ncbi:MAG: hypothetical protein S4CHLAM45_06160 [Chlamydiales bacterium]|nr:hypothetical protein [Chlamydiales bacterium]MCH9619844.1 hypothetical protein [Chlamydiales bacterium]MCH9622729.1 hypothetical protein [Chlamydiales bacterium]
MKNIMNLVLFASLVCGCTGCNKGRAMSFSQEAIDDMEAHEKRLRDFDKKQMEALIEEAETPEQTRNRHNYERTH